MMKTYEDYLDIALKYRKKLDDATKDGNQKYVIYYRGKYIVALKNAYRLDHDGILPSDVSGRPLDVPIVQEIKRQLNGHQRQLDVAIRENKQEDSPSITKEIAWKYKRLATRISQVNFSTGKANAGHIALDIASFAGSTLVKAPAMVATKTVSKVGPFAIKLFTIPINLFWATFLTKENIGLKEKDAKKTDYNDTVIYKLSESLQDAVDKTFESAHDIISRI